MKGFINGIRMEWSGAEKERRRKKIIEKLFMEFLVDCSH